MSRVLFFLQSLAGGGAERNIVNVVNNLDRSRFEPVIALTSKAGPYLRLVREDVEMVELGGARVRYSVLPLVAAIRRLRPSLVLAGIEQASVALQIAVALSRTRALAILSESNHQTARRARRSTGLDLAVRWAYKRAARVIAPSDGVNRDVRERHGIVPDKIVTIYNPVEIDQIEGLAAEEPEGLLPVSTATSGGFHVIGVGRLTRQKGFDLLIRALAQLDHDIPWRLTLLGDGPDRREIEDLADALGVADRVAMPGFVKNPYAWMARADLFVLPSRWEGFGHVIVEAMACGTPVLATRCPAGPDEIITDGVDGCLCEPDSVDALADALAALARAPEERRQLAETARSSCRRFDVGVIVPQYEQLFESVVEGRA